MFLLFNVTCRQNAAMFVDRLMAMHGDDTIHIDYYFERQYEKTHNIAT